jgi:hypothetical protein
VKKFNVLQYLIRQYEDVDWIIIKLDGLIVYRGYIGTDYIDFNIVNSEFNDEARERIDSIVQVLREKKEVAK